MLTKFFRTRQKYLFILLRQILAHDEDGERFISCSWKRSPRKSARLLAYNESDIVLWWESESHDSTLGILELNL